MQSLEVTTEPRVEEPLPIWFFVGAILLVYGLLIAMSGLTHDPRQDPIVLAELRCALWWGLLMVVSGAGLIAIGLRVHRQSRM